MACKVELTLYREARKLSETRVVGPFILSNNEARPHLLADIITLDRQEEAVLKYSNSATELPIDLVAQLEHGRPFARLRV